MAGQWALAKKYPVQILRGSALGTLVGALPGAGADIAAWMSYAMSKKFSKEPEKFGTGHVEGIVESGSANNSALAGAWIPALVFGIPGDSITAIVIGVLYMKNMNPGPTLFTTNPQNIYAVFLLFIVANIIMVPLGMLCIKVAKRILQVPRNVLMPLILLFCIVGTFAINNTTFEVGVMLVAGVIAYLLEANRFPIAPAILGVVLGGMLEENFITSMIKSNGRPGRLLRAADRAGAGGPDLAGVVRAGAHARPAGAALGAGRGALTPQGLAAASPAPRRQDDGEAGHVERPQFLSQEERSPGWCRRPASAASGKPATLAPTAATARFQQVNARTEANNAGSPRPGAPRSRAAARGHQ